MVYVQYPIQIYIVNTFSACNINNKIFIVYQDKNIVNKLQILLDQWYCTIKKTKLAKTTKPKGANKNVEM